MLDPQTVWRLPPDINVVAVSPPVRKIDSHAIAILNARRAGNRGKRARAAATDPPVAVADAAPQIHELAPVIDDFSSCG